MEQYKGPYNERILKAMSSHVPTPETLGNIYQYCRCGAVRRRIATAYEEWHVCHLCHTGLPCQEISSGTAVMIAP